MGLAGLLVLAALPLPAAPPPPPGPFEEAGRWIDQVADRLRELGLWLERRPGSGLAQLHPAPPGAGFPEGPLITIMLHHRAELGLSPEQVGRLEALRGEFAREAIRRDAELRIAEMDLGAALAQEPVDLARVEAKVREIGQLWAELRLARLRTIEQGKAVLTGEQRARLLGLLRGMPGAAPPPAGTAPARPAPSRGARL
jgi:Spy/CpxP family protein refolding chaperone